MKLAIVSHTEHYLDDRGQVVGWGPTIREINYLSRYFDEIYHVAPLHKSLAPPSSMPYDAPNIVFVPLKPSGGSSLWAKACILIYALPNMLKVRSVIQKNDVFQFRAPTGMGVYMIPWLDLFVKKPGWFKYAGNWNQSNPPVGYAWQRYYLKKQNKRKVTINGKWPEQPKQCITFENPCLEIEELALGRQLAAGKEYDGKLDFCFVGRLESAKGVGRIIDAFSSLPDLSRIGTVHFLGDGPERADFEARARQCPVDMRFYGFVPRRQVGEVMGRCHVFLLPSTASEGFPKVVAEAANYGCVPVVSDVSSIGQYIIDGENGYLVSHLDESAKSLGNGLQRLLTNKSLNRVALNAVQLGGKFTFEHYSQRIINEILPQC